MDDTQPQPITEFKSGRIHCFAWSVDGERIYLSRGIYNSDLILIRDIIKSPQQ